MGIRRTLLFLGLFGAFMAGVWAAGLYRNVAFLVEQRRQALTSAVYAAPLELKPGEDIEKLAVIEQLRRLSYSQTDRVGRPGEYRLERNRLVLFVRNFELAGVAFPALRATITLEGVRIVSIADAIGEPVDRLVIEPQPIGRLAPDMPIERAAVPLDEVPPYLVRGLLATEDKWFYYHPGVNPVRIIEAAIADLRAGRAVQGASTITQQLARTFTGSRERTLSRKLHELAVALVLELQLSKKEILNRYINDVYMGEYRGGPVYGMPLAARYFFNKDLRSVTVDEAALLIGMIRAPNYYNPRRNPEAARRRRDVVLALMRRENVIDRETYRAARASPVRLAPQVPRLYAPYFVDYVASMVKQLPGFSRNLSGVRVYTTLDPRLQEAAQRAIQDNLHRLEQKYPRLRRRDPAARLQSASVVLDAKSGAIRAMVGGRDYASSQFNRAVMAHRQVGSTFKPIVYLALLDPERSPLPRPATLATLLPDRPMSFGGWVPVNFERTYRGQVIVADALADSLNVPTAYAGSLLGPSLMVRTAHELGIDDRLPSVLSLAIGSGEATLLGLTSVYQVFAANGEQFRPYAVEAAVDANGKIIYRHHLKPRRVINPPVAYLVTYALRGVLDHGTGRAAARMGLDFPAAGKTGTSDNYHDAYFVGYTPELVCGVWVGFDRPASIGLTGARAALPAWVEFMSAAMAGQPVDFPVPRGISFMVVDPQSGLLATPYCPKKEKLAFLTGTAPQQFCPLHQGVPRLGLPPSAELSSAGRPRSVPPVASGVSGQSAMPASEGFFHAMGKFLSGLFGSHGKSSPSASPGDAPSAAVR